MNSNINNNSNTLKSYILNKTEPIVLKNVLNWDMLKWSLEDWGNVLHNEKLLFRSGLNEPTQEPQWERQTKTRDGDFNYFLNQTENNRKEWLYFDYKQLNNWFKNNDKLRQEIDWTPLGFQNIKPEDCTIWIGSKGAHTPCHMDCYGFNLVYQIYGKKLWLLFPPEENLKPTRVPYEESSVYSKLNFFNPKINDFKGLEDKCRKVELIPGDLLLVPHKWWHYVENLETSITINVWLPSIEDEEERLQEAIVQLFIKQMTTLSNTELNKIILNPNMDELILENNASSFLDTVIKCKEICVKNFECKKLKTETTVVEDNKITIDNNVGQTVPVLNREKFLNFLEQQNHRFGDVKQNLNISKASSMELIEALTNPEVINVIKNIFLKNKT